MKRLLLFTLMVDRRHPTLNFSLGWYEALLRFYDEIDIVTVKSGDFSLPARIRVHTVDRSGAGKLAKTWRFYVLCVTILLKGHHRVVFSHMNTHFTVLFWPLAKLWRLRQVQWYAHRQVTPLLKVATGLADRVVSSTREGFALPSPKLRLIGQGIDAGLFGAASAGAERRHVVTTSRITRAKNIRLIIEGFLAANLGETELRVIGCPASPQDALLAQDLARDYAHAPAVRFLGFKTPAEIAGIYRECVAFVNLSDTGSLDKANLEAAVAGLVVITCNQAFAHFLAARGLHQGTVLGGPDGDLAGALARVLGDPTGYQRHFAPIARSITAAHSLDGLISKLGRTLEAHEKDRR